MNSTHRYFTIQPKVEGRGMTKKQWRTAYREARILTRTLHDGPVLKRFTDTATALYRDMLLHGFGVTPTPWYVNTLRTTEPKML